MDLWQYYGYLKMIKEKERKDLINESYDRKVSQALFILAKQNGLKLEYEEFFDFEEKINEAFEEKTEEKDKLEGKGTYVDGEWVYEFDEICDIMKYINTANN